MSAVAQDSSDLQTAFSLHQSGRWAEARDHYEAFLQREPDHPDALHLLGLAHYQSGNSTVAVEWIARAIAANPQVAGFYNSLGVAQDALRHYPQAIASFEQAIALKPDFADAFYNLGICWQNCGDLTQAIRCYTKALAVQDNYPQARLNLGNAYQSLGQWEQAQACFREALRRNPVDAVACFNLANLFRLQGCLPEAESCLRQVLALDPQCIGAYNNLGNLLQDMNRHQEAIGIYQQALAVDLAVEPHRAGLLTNLGNALRLLDRLEDASVAYREALDIAPGFAQAHNNLGNVYKDQSRLLEALSCYEQAQSLDPGLADVLSNQLLVAQYTGSYPTEQLFALHRQFSQRFEEPLKPSWPTHRRFSSQDCDKRLKIGYVSADFCTHPVANFMLPVIEHHDKAQVEVFCYYNSVRQDAVTAQFMAIAQHWRPCHGLTDAQLAQQILADGIDILVDLAGHSAAGRLLVFARKPAPIQVSYLGYIATTGLDAMDYRLTQADVDPPGNERYYSEDLYRLPGPLWWTYRPPHNAPEPGPTPALANGYVTFGSTNNIGKLTTQVIALWAEILHRNAHSRLLVAGVPQGVGREWIVAQFAQCGIAPERLLLHKRTSAQKYQSLHAEIDIVLDPFPYNGGTTSCDALWLGVPVVTLTGQAFVSRMGYALLKSLGLPELAADTPADYVHIASALACDLPRLARLRAGMRSRVATSALCDEAGFTRKLEAAYQNMWQTWLHQSSPSNQDTAATTITITTTESRKMKKFLHVGCGPQTKARTTPAFNTPEWTEVRLDIDPSVKPDIVGTMLDMSAVADASVDAIFSSHNIEHLYAHEVSVALAEFRRVLRPDGYAVITCPDLQAICALVAEDKLTDTAYTSPAGPITPLDMLYGHRPPMARGNLYMAHRCGFTEKVLSGTLKACGFAAVASLRRASRFDLWAVAAVSPIDEAALRSIAMAHFPQ